MDYRNSGASREAVCEPRSAATDTGFTNASHSAPVIPAYLRRTYDWAYLQDRSVRWLDREFVVRMILWFQHRKLAAAAFAEIEPGQRVLQSACVYGDFSVELAKHIGADGELTVVDVADVQVQNCRRKLAGYPQASVRHGDVLHIRDRDLDAVCCYFLLHELPDDYKQGVVESLLQAVRPGGKVVFVDYHKPHWAHPIKPITSLIFDTLEPFAKSLWRNDIEDFAHENSDFEWRKQTCFGGLYQKVVATRRTESA